MLTVRLIVTGTLKEAYLKSAFEEYKKRLGAFCKFELIELKEYKLPDKPSDSEISKALAEEAKQIRPYLNPKAFKTALCIEGKTYASPEYARKLSETEMRTGELDYIIGSAYGLDETLKAEADERLSLSPMTFSHQLARILFMEVLYRTFSIRNGGKYHK